MSAEVVVFDNAALTELLQSPDGIVGADLLRRTLNVHGYAVEHARVDTGRNRSATRWSIGHDDQGLFGTVGSDTLYAEWVNNGNRYMAGDHNFENALREAGN